MPFDPLADMFGIQYVLWSIYRRVPTKNSQPTVVPLNEYVSNTRENKHETVYSARSVRNVLHNHSQNRCLLDTPFKTYLVISDLRELPAHFAKPKQFAK